MIAESSKYIFSLLYLFFQKKKKLQQQLQNRQQTRCFGALWFQNLDTWMKTSKYKLKYPF